MTRFAVAHGTTAIPEKLQASPAAPALAACLTVDINASTAMVIDAAASAALVAARTLSRSIRIGLRDEIILMSLDLGDDADDDDDDDDDDEYCGSSATCLHSTSS